MNTQKYLDRGTDKVILTLILKMRYSELDLTRNEGATSKQCW